MAASSSGEQHGDVVAESAGAETYSTEASSSDPRREPETPTTPMVTVTPSDPWASYTRTNAWDDNPQIERYVDSLQQRHRRTRSGGTPMGRVRMPPASFGPDSSATGQEAGEVWERRGSKLTDFPTETERPSLPVTPAPVRRPNFWGGDAPGMLDSDDVGGGEADPNTFGSLSQTNRSGQQLPAAQGVPTQSDWVCVHGNLWGPADCLCDLTNVLRLYKDPVAQLQKLAKQQSELLLQKLGSVEGDSSSQPGGQAGRNIGQPGGGGGGGGGGGRGEIPSRQMPFGSEDIKSPTYVAQSAPVFSPKPVKPESGHSPLQKMLSAGEEATPRTAPGLSKAMEVEEPSYQGPGAMFEKGEEYATFETPAPPTEEEKDVLET
jgi:glycogenin glucosyltransferase